MTSLQITKSHYTAGVQCPKRLYLLARTPELAAAPGEDLQLRFSQGQSIGQLARKSFPGGVLIEESGSSLDRAVQRTKELTSDLQVPAVFEAAVIHQNLLVRVDILRNNFDGSWDLIEVKSTTELKPEHLEDIAFQLMVLQGAGLKIRKAILSYVNNQVVYPDLDAFFAEEDLTEAAQQMIPSVAIRVKSLMSVLESKEAPSVLIGRQCSAPYACEFKSECWATVPKGSTLELYNYRKRKPTKFELYHQGTQLLSQFKDEVELTRFQQIQVLASKTDQPIVDREGLVQLLRKIEYPIYYFDFETIAPVIPVLPGMRPYQRIPVQFSCHVQHEPGGELEHHEFLASGQAGVDPRVECVQAMKKVFRSSGSIVAYHDDFERSLIRELAAAFAEDREFLLDLEQRFWDLEDAFQHHFYHRNFSGSVSIKKVLPYFAPELKYDSLAVKNGGQAQAQLFRLLSGELEPEERERMRQNLLAYCAQDSLAMVVIHQALLKVVGENLEFLPLRAALSS
jgi:hypothetical protein